MTATLKLKLLPRSTLKGKVGVKFPASIIGEGGVVVTTAGRDVTIGLDADTVATAVGTLLISANEATQAEAEAGTITGKIMSPLRTKQALQSSTYLTGSQINNTPAGNIAATTVQAAINELDAEKAALAHTHAIADTTGLQAALDAKAALASPALTGAPTAPTAAVGTSTTQLATTAFVAASQRERLTAARTYYVRTDGSNANNGLANTAGGAFLTVQKALDVVLATLDLAGFNVTIQVADGTYTGSVLGSSPQVGAGLITIKGNTATPSNVVLQVTSVYEYVVKASGYTILHVQDVKLVNTGGVGAAALLLASKGGVITFQNIDCGQAGQQLRAEDGGRLECLGNYTISASASNHYAIVNGQIRVQSKTITIVGTPAFTTFIDAPRIGLILVNGNTFSGGATGSRYSVIENSVIFTAGAGATYLPGNAAGSSGSGGQYV